MELDYVSGFVYICRGFNISALLIKIYFDLSLIWSVMVNMLLSDEVQIRQSLYVQPNRAVLPCMSP